MKAIVIHEYGPPDVLKYEDVPDPEPRAGEIRIRVHAATVNRVLDVSLRAGKESARGPVLPLIPGRRLRRHRSTRSEPGVTRWRQGMRVAAAGVMPLDVCAEDDAGYAGPNGMMGIKRPGGFAELVAVPACAAIALPDGLDFHHAAVVMRHVPTAWNLLFNVAELKAGETVLIMGAGGNLGSIGIQIAKNVIGAKVIAAAGSDDRVADSACELGADHGINYNTHDLHAEVMTLTGGKGVDVLYDNIANPKVLPQAFRAIGFDGRLVTAGAHAGPNVTIDFSHLYHKRITIKGRPGYHPPDVPKCFAAAAEGKIEAQIERILPLSQAAEAHRLVESGESHGQDRARSDAGIEAQLFPRAFRGMTVPLACPIAPGREECLYSGHFPSSLMTSRLRLRGAGGAQRRFSHGTAPLMPKATAVWLVENTALSFDQIADFCKLHPLEVKAIADGDAAQGIKGLDPVLTGQLTREEIEQAVADPDYRLKLLDPKVRLPEAKKKKGPRYTPVSRRQDRPNAILWLVRNHPELKDSQIMRLVGTTKSTIQAIRERTHWNAPNLQPMDPVTLGLCSQIDLDLEVHRAAKEKPVDVEAQGATLLPASETTIRRASPSRRRRSPATSSTSTRCSPSSSRSAARASSATPAAIQPYGITPARTS